MADKINFNKADAHELTKLRGIGPVVARNVVKWRDEHGAFRSWDDVAKMPGFSDRLIQELKKEAILD